MRVRFCRERQGWSAKTTVDFVGAAIVTSPNQNGTLRAPARRPPTRGSLSAGLSFGALSFLGTTLVALFTSVFIARLYGVKVVGQFALAYAPVAASYLLSTVREQPALQREAAVLPPRHPRVTGLFIAVFTFSTGLTLAVSVVAGVATYFVFHGPINHPDLVWPAFASLAGYTLFTNACMNFDSIFIAFRDGRQLLWLRLHQAVVYLLLIVGGRLISGSVWMLVITISLSWFFPCIHRMIVIRRWLTFKISAAEVRAGFAALPEMLRFGIKLTPSGLLWGACDQLGTWVLGSLSSVAAVGAYNRAWFLSQRLLEARQRLSELLFPTLVERRGSNDTEGFDRALIDSLRYTTAFLVLFASVGGGAASGIMSVFGPGFTRASTALTFLLLVPVSGTMVVVLAQALIATDRPLATSVSALARLVATFPAVLILTHTMGITGTALGMALGGAAQVVCQLVFVQREVLRLFPIWWPPRQMLGQVAAYAAGFAVPRLLLSVIPGYAGVAVALVAGTLVYGLVLAAVGLLPRDRARARMVVDRARGALPARWRPATPQRAHIGIQGEANGAGPSELDAAFRRGEELERAGDNAGAEAAYRSADRGGHAAAACNLGVLLEGRGAIAAAQAAYARADRRGDPNGAFNLGLLLQEEGDLADATAAFQRADQRGHAAAACNLGAVLELQGNVAGAAAAYRRAEARGHFGGAFNLGLLLGRQGEPAAARAAFERAEQDGGEIAELARAALADLEVPDGRQGSRSRRRFRMRVGERV